MKINPYLAQVKENYLYLFNLELNSQTLAQFENIRYVIMQGSRERAQNFARKLSNQLFGVDERFFEPVNLVHTSNFAVFRIGNILSVSHGMGTTAIESLLNNITKLLYYAGNNELEYIRVGTSGGIGIIPGSVILTETTYMPNLKAHLVSYELTQKVELPTKFDQNLNTRILNSQPTLLVNPIILANTISADDFYLGQYRYDGAMLVPEDLTIRENFFSQALVLNIRNFEMEGSQLAAFCAQVEIPAAMLTVTLADRLISDQVTLNSAQLTEFTDRAQTAVINYLFKAHIAHS